MTSMTGYGRGQYARRGISVTVEISSVNRRQTDITVHLPQALESIEPRIREAVAQRITRGKITVRVSLEVGDEVWSGQLHLNKPLAKAYVNELRAVARELELPADIGLDCIVNLPGVVELPSVVAYPEQLWSLVEKALTRALRSFMLMRAREGRHLARDLATRLRKLRKLVGSISRSAARLPARYRKMLINRIRTAGLESINPNDERVLKEVVLFADRCDITEEITRLKSHFDQCEECLKSKQAMGRTLDFLAQEMHREINTIASKANDTAISRAVIEFKTELERFREQVQNVE
ncbi:MAG: YicC family protein [Verrucomicrobiae bacterium]|nr:YicC family protein [Verrucomicrobiae bacterium]